MHRVYVIMLFAALQAFCYDFSYGEYEADVHYFADDCDGDIHRRIKRAVACGPGQVDTIPASCTAYKKYGWCTTASLIQFMTANCPVTCGFCVPCIPDRYPVSLCRSFKRWGFCASRIQVLTRFMGANCFTTCGFCPVPVPTTMPPPTTTPTVPTTMPTPTTTPAVNGSWSVWGVWGACSVTCGGGQQMRNRTCNNPPPSGGGADCVGNSSETQSCSSNPCPVNGSWSVWGVWGACSVTCGRGQQTRRRSCNNPPPSGGGADCVGNSSETQSCNSNPCPGYGGWSDWSSWSACSESCGVGLQLRTRNCSNPPPTTPEGNCKGLNFELQPCNTTGCVVHGQWSLWGSWGRCSKTCGGGARLRVRSCNNPAPSGGGAFCGGLGSNRQSCNTHSCNATAPTTLTPVTSTQSPLSATDAACLKVHNEKRTIHGSPPLKWNATLADHARFWAHELVRLGNLVHEPNITEGENLFKSSGQTEKTCVDAVEGWYGEVALYNFNNPGFSPSTAHFTQIVWKDTMQVGVAVITEVDAQTGNLLNYIVARYTPAGNVKGEFEENVLPVNIID